MINQTIDVTHNNPKAETHIWEFNNDLSFETQHKITNSSRNLNLGNYNLEILNYEVSMTSTTQTQKQCAMIRLWTMHITLTFIIWIDKMHGKLQCSHCSTSSFNVIIAKTKLQNIDLQSSSSMHITQMQHFAIPLL
jgi:hypothetical protein